MLQELRYDDTNVFLKGVTLSQSHLSTITEMPSTPVQNITENNGYEQHFCKSRPHFRIGTQVKLVEHSTLSS